MLELSFTVKIPSVLFVKTSVKKVKSRDFPGGPVAETPVAPKAGGPGSIPGWGTKIPHAIAKTRHSQINKH